jgi:hypothetical protein
MNFPRITAPFFLPHRRSGGVAAGFEPKRFWRWFPCRAQDGLGRYGPPPPRWLGGLLLITSGFTSFMAHAGRPPVNAYVMHLARRIRPDLFYRQIRLGMFPTGYKRLWDGWR